MIQHPRKPEPVKGFNDTKFKIFPKIYILKPSDDFILFNLSNNSKNPSTVKNVSNVLEKYLAV